MSGGMDVHWETQGHFQFIARGTAATEQKGSVGPGLSI